jgi:catechol 2,3-dioxygenase-like lactoylglutathione lyase family enzyme
MGTHENRTSTTRTGGTPGFSGILETALYVDDLEKAENFYRHVLGLEKIFSVPGRQLVFRCQESILLIFNPGHTERERTVINGGTIPLHGARGAGHAAFRVAKSDLESWRKYFREVAVLVESEVSWPNGAHSIYFRDPAGNSLELATPDMWTTWAAERKD